MKCFTFTRTDVCVHTQRHTSPLVLPKHKFRILLYRKHCLGTETFFKFPNYHETQTLVPSMVPAVISAMEKRKKKINKLVFKAGFEKTHSK